MEFSENLKNVIETVSSALAPDFEESMIDEDEDDFELILAETTLDAGRMIIFGGREGKEADDEVRDLIREHGYDAVLKEAKKYVCS